MVAAQKIPGSTMEEGGERIYFCQGFGNAMLAVHSWLGKTAVFTYLCNNNSDDNNDDDDDNYPRGQLLAINPS